VVKCIFFYYLAATKGLGLTYSSEWHDSIGCGVTDADRALQIHWKAISNSVFLIDGSIIS
jgi:hypothetical protein